MVALAANCLVRFSLELQFVHVHMVSPQDLSSHVECPSYICAGCSELFEWAVARAAAGRRGVFCAHVRARGVGDVLRVQHLSESEVQLFQTFHALVGARARTSGAVESRRAVTVGGWCVAQRGYPHN